MLIKTRLGKSGEWGFLEKYEHYTYNSRGNVKALTAVNIDSGLAPVYAFKGSDFVPLKEIDETVGLDRYIKAKKPFYAKINEGFIVSLTAKVDFFDRVYYPEESTFEVYVVNGDLRGSQVAFKKLLDVPEELGILLQEPLRILGESFGNREVFLRSRNG